MASHVRKTGLVSPEHVQQILVYRLLEAWHETEGAVDAVRHEENAELEEAIAEVSEALGVDLSRESVLVANALIRAVSRTVADVVNGTGPAYLSDTGPREPSPGQAP